MRNHSSLDGAESNIVAIPDLPKLLDPVFLSAHQLVDQVSRDRLIGLLPLLRRAVRESMVGPALSEPVGEKNFSAAARKQAPTPGSLAAAGPDGGLGKSRTAP